MSLIEIDDSPYEDRKEYILGFIEANSVGFVGTARIDEIEFLVCEIMQAGIKKKDAAHLACSIIAGCDYFVTTDNRVLNYRTDKIKIVNPVRFIKIWRGIE